MTRFISVSDEQWAALAPLFPQPAKRGRGKPHTSWRSVVNSILFVLEAKLKWSSIPRTPEYATKSAAHRWFLAWQKSGFLSELLKIYEKTTQRAAALEIPPRRTRHMRQSNPIGQPEFHQEEPLEVPASVLVGHSQPAHLNA